MDDLGGKKPTIFGVYPTIPSSQATNPPSMPPSPSTGSPPRADQVVPGGGYAMVGIYTVRPIDPMGYIGYVV